MTAWWDEVIVLLCCEVAISKVYIIHLTYIKLNYIMVRLASLSNGLII